MNTRVVFSIIVGLAVYVVLGYLLNGPAHCVDGSLSGSIGHRGACSHHGGVADPSFIPLLTAIAAGFVAYRVWGTVQRRHLRRRKALEPVAVVDAIAAQRAEVIRNLASNLSYYDETSPAYGIRDYYTKGPATESESVAEIIARQKVERARIWERVSTDG